MRKRHCGASKKTSFLLVHFILLGLYKSLPVQYLSITSWFGLNITDSYIIIGSSYLFAAIVRLVSGLVVDLLGHWNILYVLTIGFTVFLVGGAAFQAKFFFSESLSSRLEKFILFSRSVENSDFIVFNGSIKKDSTASQWVLEKVCNS